MKLTDGTIIVVRQIPPDQIELAEWFIEHTFNHYKDQTDVDLFVTWSRIALICLPYVSIENVTTTTELGKFFLSHRDDFGRIVAAIFGRSVTQVPEWIKNANSGSPSDAA